jgi:HlyD family secretion protein
MTATATIKAKQVSDALLVPNTALRFTPASADSDKSPSANKKGLATSLMPSMPRNKSNRKSGAERANVALAKQVWVLPKDGGAAIAVAVKPGISDGHMTQIIGGDLKVGMQVITDQKVVAQ